jgi:hypothetical protein
MTEWNEEYWDIDGTSLHGLGWSVGTVGGLSLPPLRGSNTPSAKRPGQLHNADKVPDSTTLVMPMWVAGIDNQTGIPAANPKLTLNDNLKTLRRLVAPAWRWTSEDYPQTAFNYRWYADNFRIFGIR